MQAIQVKSLSVTDTKRSRIKAWSYSGESVTLDRDNDLEMNENYRSAALELLKKLDWKGAWIGGCLPNQDYAFVCIDSQCPLAVGLHV